MYINHCEEAVALVATQDAYGLTQADLVKPGNTCGDFPDVFQSNLVALAGGSCHGCQ